MKDAKGQYVIFDEDVHSTAPLTPSQRYYLKKTLRLSMDIDMLRYLEFEFYCYKFKVKLFVGLLACLFCLFDIFV